MEIERQPDLDELVRDVHAKMIDSELMEKYHLSAVELKGVLKHLIDTKVLTLPELYSRPILSDERSISESRRQSPRFRLAFLVSIYESDSPKIRGWLTDITEKGMGTTGMMRTWGDKSLRDPSKKIEGCGSNHISCRMSLEIDGRP